MEGRAVSTGEVFDKISARLVPFEMVAKVFKDMTSEGGKFYNMQEVQAETLRGKISNLKDAYEVMLNEIGSQKSGTMKSAVDSVKNLMQNWEKVGDILITVAHSYGLYKAAMLGAWAVEKYMAATKIIEKYDKLNAVMLAQGKTVNKLKNAWVALGASKKAAIGIGLAVIGALVTAIGVAIKDATKLRKELESIMSAEFNSSDKAVNDLDRLVSNLKKANRGSQEYRETISELNRKYGEYLPNILKEADSYEKVEAAANAAAIAIRNKAKANAFEKGSAAIEDDMGADLTKRTSAFRSALTNMPAISKDAANEFIKNFNLALAEDGAMDDIEKTLRDSFDSYFGKGKFEEYEVSFALGSLVFDAKRYAETRDKVIQAEKDLQDDLDARFDGAAFSSLKEREEVSKIEKWYRDELSNNDDALKKLTLTQNEYNRKVEELDIEKLRKLVATYKELGRDDIAKQYQAQLDEMLKVPDGWRGKVQKVLKDMGLDKGTSFGLWAEDTTQSTTYVDEMIKRYKELGEEIDWVSSFDKEQTERLQKNKDAIEAIAKALNIDIKNLAANKSDRVESIAERQLKTQIELVKKLQDAYEKLSPFLTDSQMRDTLGELFPEAKKEWLESFDFSEVLRKMADDLAQYDDEASTKLKASIGKDVAGSLAEAFKEIEAYKKTLDEWMGEDFALSGKGVSFDISKIVRDLNNQYAQIDQKRLKSLELLKKAEEGDAQSLAIVRKYLGEEVWNKYLTKGRQVIDELTQKEKRSARDVANEKIRDKASEYVSEEIKNNNIDLSDFNDKTISQIQTLISRLKTIRDKAQSEANKAFADVVLGKIDEGQYAKWQMLLEVIELLGIKIEDTEEEFDKKMIDKTKEAMDAIGGLGSEISNLGSAIEDADIQKFGEDIQDVTNFASGLIEAMKSKDTIAIIANIVSYAISSITDVVNAAIIKEEALYEATIKLRDAIWESMRDSTSGIWGTDEMALAKANIDIATQALENYKKKLNEFEKIQRQRDKYNEDSILFPTKVDVSLSDIVGLQANLGGWELYRENGELNIKALSAYYDSYKNELTRKQKLLVRSLIESGEAYNDAAAQQAEYLTSLFGGVADDIATSMVDAFIESGDAAIDMGNIISDVSKQMVADLIKSVYLMPILKGYEEQFKAIDASTPIGSTENTEQKLNLLETALQEISGQSDAITETIERFADYLGTGEGAGTSDLGEGIKGITEDQANLLASYLNAIRADVSYSKTLWVKMDANLQRIADMLTSSPTLMEYQAQIAANTYNTAITTQAILDRLVGVIGLGDNGEAIKVVS